MKTLKKKNIQGKLPISIRAIFTLLLFVLFASSGLYSQEYLRVYTSGPGIMTSNVTGGTVVTEEFSDFTGIPNYNWAPLPNGYTSSIGTYTQTDGQSYVKNDDRYGAGTGKYLAIKTGGEVRLVFDEPVRYFAFAWPAGDGQNNIKIIRNEQVIGTFETADVIALLPKDQNNFITSINGTQYSTYDYYGKPGTGQNSGEPYAFLHYVATEGLAFDEVVFAMGNGGEFENDNHTLLIGTPELQGDWVELISIETPTANDDSETGTPGQPVEVDVLDNDQPGDAAIDPSTVIINGTDDPGDDLVVSGEGTWSVNTTTGAITFTPEAGFIGSPTPIEYSVQDVDGYASNLATVTVTYPVGPTANDDSEVTALDTPIDINVLSNDVAGSTALDPTSVTLVSGTEPNPTTEGTFTVNTTTGVVTFTPVNGFTGTVTVYYSVCDQNSLCDEATITVDVVSGASNLFPANGYGTLAFEDLWPGKGDYDFNDLVVDYQFAITSNVDNYIETVVGTFKIRAIGAFLQNGFGFQLSSAINPADLNVSGYSLSGNIITLESNGTEANQTIPTIIVFDNAFNEMPHPGGGGIGVNTEESAPYVEPVELVITIDFTSNTYTYNDLDIGNFNPFIFVDQNRSHEVHLPDYPPTALSDQGLFGTQEDDSNPGEGRYYKTVTNLPWAINIYDSFEYPIEKQQVVWAYLKFAAWAESEGATFTDWYQDLSGYRNNSLIYTPPTK